MLCDLADPATHLSLVEAAWNWRGPIDAWINNAGVDVLTGETKSWPFDRKLEELLKVDVVATIHISRLVGQRMQDRGAGSIVNMGWDHADCGDGRRQRPVVRGCQGGGDGLYPQPGPHRWPRRSA